MRDEEGNKKKSSSIANNAKVLLHVRLDHRAKEVQRRWDTSGLQGLPLKLVQGDQNGRNWWRKVVIALMHRKF
ncbi:hypothetical protein RIF29_16109 [Crotalaria pallida]|uniref:Uncharacterized protein n=1 Tax=Crotalaria pallida TaxID=3830 RepID=A0AAN9IBR2_CROPI